MAHQLLRLAGRQLLQSQSCKTFRLVPCATVMDYRPLIGNREIVGYGINGDEMYLDRVDYPMPAIRWKESTPEVLALREKEKGDWKKLSLEDKKAIYRASFCQTYSEMNAPTGYWKVIIGGVLSLISIGLWAIAWTRVYVFPPRGASFSEESRQAQLRRMIALEVNPIDGLSSKWDYEKNTWKK